MPLARSLLPGLLVLAGTTYSRGQLASSATASTETTPAKLLPKAGLNAGRAIRCTGYHGLAARLLPRESNIGYVPNNSALNITTQLNCSVYFGRWAGRRPALSQPRLR